MTADHPRNSAAGTSHLPGAPDRPRQAGASRLPITPAQRYVGLDQGYAALLLPSVQHLHAPLAGGMGDQRGQCARARDEVDVREVWCRKVATLHNEHAAR
ncbi:hypothetical protein OG232_04150 [Streptomyces sp. NBC_01411]|uniref:hypothetical protein n=1 Tax=Streptomyces sp. NBC_01411 TaxID=2903857 RepID=UPI00325656DD